MCLKIDALVTDYLNQLNKPINRFVIAYSGGLDSTVLFHMLTKNPLPGIALEAVHVNHQLSPNALVWQNHCEQQAKKHGVPCSTHQVSIGKSRHGYEAAAREARYAILKQYAIKGTIILTAHHADDQVETVLGHIIRGCGITGLTGIPALVRFSTGYLLRPLLNVSRAELEAYAKQYQLTYVTDESNFDVKYTRNIIRHQAVPFLQERFPTINQQILSLQKNAFEAEQLLNEYAAQLYQLCQVEQVDQLKIVPLAKLSSQQQRLVLRFWLHEQNNLTNLTRAQLISLQNVMLNASSDSQPLITFGQHCCRRFQQCLYITKKNMPETHNFVSRWNLSAPLQTPVGELDPELVKHALGLSAETTVEVRFRRGGERIHPTDRVGSHPLKKCFQEWRIPPWLRSQLPLIYYRKKLVMIYGVSIALI